MPTEKNVYIKIHFIISRPEKYFVASQKNSLTEIFPWATKTHV